MDRSSEPEHQQSLREIFEQIDAAAKPKWGILNLVLENAKKIDAELPHIILACAIPRRFDHHIVGILRDKPGEEDRNQQLLKLVCSNSFVNKREDGYFVYRDDTRDAILEDWRSTDEKKEQFVTINKRLTTFYENEYSFARQSELDLISVFSIMSKVNLPRFRKLTSLIEKRLLLSLLEALYQSLLASTTDGFEFFRQKYYQQEGIGHIMVCKALTSAIRDFLLRLPVNQQDSSKLAWLDYFELRTQKQLTPFDLQIVEEKLQQFSARKDIEKQLRNWILNELVNVKDSQQKLRESEQIRKELLSLAEQSPDDVYNLPIYYGNLGNLYWTLGELDNAIEYFKVAIEKSELTLNARADTQVISRLDLSGIYCEAGQWEKGMEVGMEALYLARTQFANNQSLQSSVAHRLMILLLPYDQHAAETAASEFLSLLQDNEQYKFDSVDKYIAALDSNGQTRLAKLQLKKLREEINKSDHPEQYMLLLLFREALINDNCGLYEKAIKKYSQLPGLESEGQINNWTRAAALSNRGRMLAMLGRWKSAEKDFQEAMKLWKSYGHEVLTAFIHVLYADMLRSRGLFTEAQAELDLAANVLTVGIKSYNDEYYVIQGDIYHAQSNWKMAEKYFKKALEIRAARNDSRLVLKSLNKLCDAAVAKREWASAARYSAQALQKCQDLNNLDSFSSSRNEEKANRKNSEGMRLYCQGSDITQACEQFRSAIEDVQQNFWYQLNLSFANAKRGFWLGAAQAMEKTLILAPEPARTIRLYLCWRDYLVKYAESFQQKHDYSTAIQVIRDTLDRLKSFLPSINLIDLRLRLGDNLLSEGLTQEAMHEYAIGLEQALSLHLVDKRLQFLMRISLIDTMNGQLGIALSNMKGLFDEFQNEKGFSIASALTELIDFVQTPQQFNGCVELLRALIFTGKIASDYFELVNDKILDLVNRRYYGINYPLHRFKPQSRFLLEPLPTPIALELSGSLVPTDNVPAVDWMLKTGFPDLRTKILREMGVLIPGIKLRTNVNNPPGGYFHSLFDIPLWLYTVYEEKRFCPYAEKCREINLSGIEANNYGSEGGTGLWIDESEWPKVEAAGLPLLDPYQYLTTHTESVIRDNLVSFFGVQELRQTLGNWIKGADPFLFLPHDEQEIRQKTVDTFLLDDQAFQQLLQVLQAFISENIPILRLDRILDEFISVRKDDKKNVSEIIEQIRLVISEDLPGNINHLLHIKIPEELENFLLHGIHRQDGKVFFALSPKQVQDFILEIRTLLEKASMTKPALVVSIAQLRPMVKAILAFDFPHIPVLAERELIEEKEKL